MSEHAEMIEQLQTAAGFQTSITRSELLLAAADRIKALESELMLVTVELESALRAIGIPDGISATHKARALMKKATGT
jgi:hypothetical protein